MKTETRQETCAHTQGPWEAIGTVVRTCRKADGSGGLEIATCSLLWSERRENALLIASAPELLALAKKLAGECAECSGRGYTFSDDGITGFGPDDREPKREACADCADIREAIDKAVGRG